MKHAVLHFRTGEPDFSDLPDYEYDWAIYGKVHEEIPTDIAETLGQRVVLQGSKTVAAKIRVSY